MADSGDSRIHPFVEELVIERMGPKQFSTLYLAPKDPAGLDTPLSILNFLEVAPADLSAAASKALDAIEAPGGDHHQGWTDFKWKLTAFTYVQDVFDAMLRQTDDSLVMFQQYYFYYESYYLLCESILCGLNGFYFAAQALLRPFLEFSLLQNYYYRMLRDSASYRPLELYFKNGRVPASNAVVKMAMPKDQFTKLIRFRVNQHLGGLSESTLHPYHPDYSVRQHSSVVGKPSFEGLHFWFTTRLIVESALWVYYVNFPLLFHPVDVMRKFGYNGPAGLFVDEPGGKAVKESLSAEDYAEFKKYSDTQEGTTDRLAWFEGFPNLTDAQIETSWKKDEDGEFPGLWAGYCAQMARLRVLRRSMAVHRANIREVPDSVPTSLNSLADWRKFSTKVGR